MSYQKMFSKGFITLPNELLEFVNVLKFTPESFMLWLHLYREMKNGEVVLNIERLVNLSNLEEPALYHLINILVNQQLIRVTTREDVTHKLQTIVDLSPTFERLDQISKQPTLKLNKLAKLSQVFEQELGRQLSPFELEEVQKWVEEEKHTPELVSLALKEAVLNKKTNFKYIGAILRNWQEQGCQTPSDIEERKAQPKRGNILDIHLPID
ncbi:MAG: DnaD domain protein [Streptococcaceae bacterium]|jgi:DNA replication protein|nr:DnaD domain protein [Streptococcaceae bacterium]